MTLLPSQENKEKPVVTIIGKKKIIKNIPFKVRCDIFEIAELDKIANSLGYKERATAFRYLLQHYGDIATAQKLVTRYAVMRKAIKDFEDGLL